MDVLLGIDNVEERKQKEAIATLDKAKRSTQLKISKYNKYLQKYNQCRNEVVKLLGDIDKTLGIEYDKLEGGDLLECIKEILRKYTPHQDKVIEKNANKISDLSTELYKKKMLLFNIKRAQAEYSKYVEEISSINESLKPVEYLNQHLSEYGVTIWGQHILDELKISLSKIRSKKMPKEIASIVSDKNVENLEREISECENQLKALSEVKLKPVEQSSLYLALGQLKSLFPILTDLQSQIPTNVPSDYDYANDKQIRDHANMILSEIETRRGSVVRGIFDKYIQDVYDALSVKDNFENYKTRFNREKERLELSDGKSILNYSNIGSQSNYMYLHICFFLGMHNFLLDNPCKQVGNFLFIDQPSVPYYENSNENKSNDKTKLLDVFKVINAFMEERIKKGKEFQIILIEHAEESYWTGENALSTFVTRANFDGDEALVPQQVIRKYRNEN